MKNKEMERWCMVITLIFLLPSEQFQVKGASWTAAWSLPGISRTFGRMSSYTDEEIVEQLYSRPSRSPPDHPSYTARKMYQMGVGVDDSFSSSSYVAPESLSYMSFNSHGYPSSASYSHRIVHQ